MEKSHLTLRDKKFYIRTFGCQMNENDSERVAGLLVSEGAQLSNSPEDCQIIIINTCAVREKSEEKLYSLLGRLSSIKKKKDVIIGVSGCIAQLYDSDLMDKKPIIDFIIGPDNYHKIPEILAHRLKEKTISTEWNKEWEEIPHTLTLHESSVSSYVTIMEGCNNFCAYCIVPYTRGREKYRPAQNVLNEVKDLAKKRYKEIFLLGQNVNSYRDPETGKSFSELLKEIDQIDGIQWIRFITSHPKNFERDLALTMKESNKICHQLHLPLQSGSSSVLKKMNRGYTREDYLKKVTMLRDFMPDISLSTDIIVGFPGESEEDFQDTLKILKIIGFTNIFSFRYSPRPRTSAAINDKNNVPFDEKKKRLIELQAFQKQLQLEMNESLIGQEMKVLCAGKSKKNPEVLSGRNEAYQVINFKAKYDCTGQFVRIKITSCGPYSLFGELSP